MLINKMVLDRDLQTTFRLVKEAGFDVLDLMDDHFLEVSKLPMHDRDPFDRMLSAQAKAEEMQILTADPHFKMYDVPLIRV